MITYYISSALFALFGLKMLHEGYHMSPNEGQEEYEEVNEELRKKEEEGGRGGSLELGRRNSGAPPTVLGFLGKIPLIGIVFGNLFDLAVDLQQHHFYIAASST